MVCPVASEGRAIVYGAGDRIIEAAGRLGEHLAVTIVLTGDDDPETAAILKFTQMLTQSPKWDTTLLPIRAGLLLAIKR